MSKYRLNKEDAVLVVIDLQDRLMNAMPDKEKVYKNTGILLQTAQQLNIPVIVSEQYPRGLGSTVAEIKEHLKDYEYIEKTSFSVCEALQAKLAGLKRKTLIITGSETHVCVYQTVRDMVAEGYQVHVVQDAVCSRFPANYQNGIELMRDLGAVITSTETVVFDLLKEAGTADFKALSPLIK
ncbi:Isochorismatase-like [Syntrophomonas zehnderi OL-4]|uniref:Isochorismatase-like n=1 Tax=Syntrophomonas zehnderi OL-4 TaxID=690567 RepID=A0A0E4GAU1_9FIRM|nr:hydrolase [Syntrophomonas zehnderi]CFX68834.1 Isochorismatase-like [Syntrophomonas zehnderi OL-4]